MKKLRITLSAVVALALTAACSSNTSSKDAAEPTGLTTVTVGIIPIIDVAALYLGNEKGFFKDEGLRLNLEPVQTGAASIAAVVSGSQQFGFSAPVPIFTAATKGVPLKIVANAESPVPDLNGIVVAKNSHIKNVHDLSGKVIAVNALAGQDEVLVRAAIDESGGDSSNIHIIAIPFADMTTALESGRVAAALMATPFYHDALDSGMHAIIPDVSLKVLGPDATISGWITSTQYLSSHQQTVAKFRKATEKSNEYAQAHPDEVRQIVGTYTSLRPDVVQKIALPKYPQQLDTASLQKDAELMQKYGLIQKKVDVPSIIAN